MMLNSTYSDNDSKKKSNNDDDDGLSETSVIFLSIGVILFVIVLGVGAAYFYLNKKEKNQKNGQMTSTLINQTTSYNNENMT